MNKAPFSYFGGKYRLLNYLQAHLPPVSDIDCYIEPFFGSGTLFFNRERLGEAEVINDYNSYIYTFFKVLRDRRGALLERLKYTPYSAETFYEARKFLAQGGNAVKQSHLEIPVKQQVYTAWAIYILYSMSIMNNGRSFSRGSNDTGKAREFKDNLSRLDYCTCRLQDAVIENEDAIKVLKRYDSPRTFVYLDPPYLNVRNDTGMKQSYHGNNGVKKENEENGLHERLMEWCLSAKSMIMLSNYPNDLYDTTLRNWNREEIMVKVTPGAHVRGKSSKTLTAIEVIWTSPNVPQKKQLELFNG